MPIYDYIIVGGGISGLYMAYKLQDTKKDILLLESSNRLGGRILTETVKGVQMELGAARFSEKHTKMMSLIKELGLQTDLLELPEKVVYKGPKPHINFYSLLDELYSKKKHYSKQYLETITLLQFAIDVLGQDQANQLQYQLGYDAEFQHLNAYHALKIHKKDLFSSHKYYILKHGLSSIVDAIEKSFQSNVTVKLDTYVTDIGSRFVSVNSYKYRGDTIFACVPQKALHSFPKMKECLWLSDVQSIPLLRIYAKYPVDKQGHVWFEKIARTVTNNYIRHIIPIDASQGLIMISYTDCMYADMWKQLDTLGDSVLIDHLHKEINHLFKLTPPKPEFIKTYYWSQGVHMWKPGLSVASTYAQVIKPFDKEKIYVINESFSKHQGWIEGCLEMCYDVFDQLPNFSRTKAITGGKKQSVKLYTLSQVLKKRNWIILDLKGKLRIYDVGKWLSKHPGGTSNLRLGIKANKHYKDKQKYPKSPIQLFKSISAHTSGKVITTMLLKESNLVKFIGYCKKV